MLEALRPYALLFPFAVILAVIAWGSVDSRKHDREGRARRAAERSETDATRLAAKRSLRSRSEPPS